ncbi:MAG: restriction endonuclease, partial [Clostridia bacterium]|nr:restriction endonuclease [Clostridia bacterium]
LSKGHPYDMSTNIFDRLPQIFHEEKPNDNYEYIQILGRKNNSRIYQWMRKDYLKENSNIYKYKVILPKANGSGALGEVIPTPLIGSPLIGFTETFISVGEVDTREEAEAILKYIKSKFARTLLGVLKITQDNTRQTWRKVPLQDFSAKSDIDWSGSVADIDRQLYAKYGLSDEEADFIETHVKEMV